MINNILFFVKFGERKHLESLLNGNIYFSTTKRFHEIEEIQLIKGQGDRKDGLFNVPATNMLIADYNNSNHKINLKNTLTSIDFGQNSQRPTFCITAGTIENC